MSGSGSNSVSLNALLKKTEHYDKDERYMAISDLCEALKRHAASAASSSSDASPSSSSGGYQSGYQQQLQQSQVIDASTERRICTAVLSLLDDSSNDVQTVAVKTLSVLLTTVHEEQVMEIADRLCTLVLDSSKSDLRDVYAIGLKTLVETVPLQMGDLVSHRLVGRLIDGISRNSTSSSSASPADKSAEDKSAEDITLACLNVLTDLLTRFGSSSASITRQHEQILHVTLSQLASDSHVVRKRAGSTIGCLAVVISDHWLHLLVERLLGQIDLAEGLGKSGKRRARQAHQKDDSGKFAASDATRVADTRALIRTMCTVSGAVGHRLKQEQIDRIVPIFLRFCDPDDAVTGDDENDFSDEEMGDTTDEDDPEEEDEATIAMKIELRESCFAGFESFVLRCPSEIQPHLSQIVHSALAYMRYDPNYSYGEEDNEFGEGGGGGDDDNNSDIDENESEGYDDDDDAYSDEDLDDDMSDDEDDDNWKVRRSAIRTLTAVVEATKHDPSKLWIDEYAWRKNKSKKATVAGALVNRFKEREENCRVDIIDCFTRLLSYTVAAASSNVLVLASPDAMDTTSSAASTSSMGGVAAPVVIDLRTRFVPAIVKACEKQLSAKKGGERSKSSALALLSTLCAAPGGIGGMDQINSVFKHIQAIISSGGDDGKLHRQVSLSKSLKLDALCLVRTLLACKQHDPIQVKDALLATLLEDLCRAVQEDWYKVIAEALRVLTEIPRLLVLGLSRDTGASGAKDEMDKVATVLYDAIEPRLAAHDLDQEIKECALFASASLLSVLHPSLDAGQRARLLSIILERLKNESTRIAAIKTLSAIAKDRDVDVSISGGKRLDLSPMLTEAVSELASLLRQQSRGVKQSALECLDVVIRYHGADDSATMDAQLFDTVLKELGAIIVDSDLHISHLSLRASMSVSKTCPSCGPSVRQHILPPALSLSTSPLLQDLALESLLSLLEQLVASNAVGFDDLFSSLQSRLTSGDDQSTSHGGGGSKQSVSNLAKCIAVITAATTQANRDRVVSDLITLLESSGKAGGKGSTRQVQLSLLISGDLGRRVDLSAMGGVAERLQRIYLSSFESSNEDIKHAAAYGLGRASVGAMDVFLPAILDALEQNKEKKQYLLLSALRELIHCYQIGGGGNISPSVPLILPHLMNHCSDSEEGVRTMVAECLGSLACLEPDAVLPQLQDLATKHSRKDAGGTDSEKTDAEKTDALICWTVATAVKFAIAGHTDPSKLSPFMPSFLKLLAEDDLSVKNAALLMVYSAVHHTSQLVAGLMQEHILPSLYELAQLNLKRVVDLGPFKHTVDDALPLRKAALSIFSTCLEKCPSSLDIPAFMPILAKALEDVEDIQLQAHQIVISMCNRHPMPLVAAVDTFVEPLEKTINKKKGQKTGTELERANEWIKSGLRAMVALSQVDGVMNCRKFADFVDRTKKNSKFHPLLEALDEER